MSFDNQDIQQLNDQLKKTYPDMISLPSEVRHQLVKSVAQVIHETYPRYDNYTLAELAEVLDDYVDPVVDKFLCNYDRSK